MTFELVETFKHRNRKCVIVRHDVMGIGHNGYVTVAPRNHGCDYYKVQSRIDVECLTFNGNLTEYGFHDHQWFLGFDTLHAWNFENPETRTYAAVKAKTIELANEMVDKGI